MFVFESLEAARQAVLMRVRSKMFVLLLALIAASGVLYHFVAGEISHEVQGDEFFGMLATMFLLHFVVPVGVLYLGSVAVHTEIEDRTVNYLFVRPVRRASVLVGKWLAVSFLGCAVLLLALGVLWGTAALGGHQWQRGVGIEASLVGTFAMVGCAAVAAYAAAGCAFGAVFRRPIVVALAFYAGWEVAVSHLPPQAGVRGWTVADPMRRWLYAELQPTGELRDVLQQGLDRIWLQPEALGDPARTLVWFTAVMLAWGLWVYCRREYDSRPRD